MVSSSILFLACVHLEGHNNLGLWCYQVKKQYYDGKLAPERQAKLDAVDFDWTVNRRNRKGKTPSQEAQVVAGAAAEAAVAAPVTALDRQRQDGALAPPQVAAAIAAAAAAGSRVAALSKVMGQGI